MSSTQKLMNSISTKNEKWKEKKKLKIQKIKKDNNS